MNPVRIALIVLFFSLCSSYSQDLDVWIGTGNPRLSEGIYHCSLNTANGRLTEPKVVGEIKAPGFLAMHPDGKILYSVGSLEGKNVIAAWRITGKGKAAYLKLLNAVETSDGGAAHLCVDKTGTTVVSAQYGGGSVAVFALARDGSISRRTQLIEHEGGSNVVERRQSSPHPHWTGVSPDNRFVFIPDLGLDQVVVYQLDPSASQLKRVGKVDLHPGAGPRHMKFHTSGKWVYVLNELDLTVSVFDYHADTGLMTFKHRVAAVPAEELAIEKAKSASEIRVHPSGKFVYSANRGHDTITAYKVDLGTGKLQVLEREAIRGATPRNFNLDPSGKWILAGGQSSNTLASFAVDQESGELVYNQAVVNVPSPICVLFQPE